MGKLEELKPSAVVGGILPDGSTTVVSVQWFGSEAIELTYKTATGKVANELLYREDALVQSWPEIVRLAREAGKPKASQATLFEVIEDYPCRSNP